ncbi:MAG: hypothetical protein H7A20_12695 [Rhodanobacteraceae bacterium]|nr:hypothetical protein [Rhodanobacteraceae bacterium]HPF74402.1 hypothetical protein [Xanthomonadaceae bacterium]HRY00222.1 hypothetical protein [Xanthomonadaceae bacterium]
MATTPERRFVIVPHRPRTRVLLVVIVLGWLLTLWLASDLTARYVGPDSARLRGEVEELQKGRDADAAAIDKLEADIAVLGRSDQVSRSAVQSLQEDLADRDERIAQLRADVAFYERLVDAASKRQGLSVHSLRFTRRDDGAWRYVLTLTQNLKRSKVSSGDVRLSIDGAQDGQLKTLDWPTLRQDAEAAPLTFEFKYFQQLKGSVMLPEGFTPHRVHVQLKSADGNSEPSFSWQEIQAEKPTEKQTEGAQ